MKLFLSTLLFFLGSGPIMAQDSQHALANTSTVAALPRAWVNQHECDGQATVLKLVCHMGDAQCRKKAGDYEATAAGLNQAITDAENLRIRRDLGTILRITVGADIQVNKPSQAILLRNLGYTGTKCIILESSKPLPTGVRVGSITILSISRSSAGLVTVVNQRPHGLKTGDRAQIRNVTGAVQNFNGIFPVKRLNNRTFTYVQPGPAESGIVTPFFTVVTGPNTLAQQKAASMYTLESTGVNTWVVATDPGAHHYVFYDGEAETTNTGLGQGQPIVFFGPNPAATTFADNGSHIGFDRMYVHGCAGIVPTTIPVWPEPIPCGSLDAGLKTGVRLNCAYCWVMNSFFDQMQMPGIESHAVGTYDGQGPFKIVNNHLRGSATTLHFGNTPPSVTGLVPSDLEIRLNTIDLDPNWFSLSNCGGTVAKWGLKARLDLENFQRMLLDGNELYQSWCDGDTGEMAYIGPGACSLSGCTGGNTATTTDLTFTNNLVAHTYSVFLLHGRGNIGGHIGMGMTFPAQRFDIINNLFWDVGVPAYGSGLVHEYSAGAGGETYTCAVSRSQNVASLTSCICNGSNCPTTGTSSGDYVLTTNCSDSTFNTSRNPAIASDPNTTGPVTYSNSGQDVSGGVTCTLSNQQGWPRLLNFRHNTMIANGVPAGVAFTSNPNGPGAFFTRDFTMLDSISSNAGGASTNHGWFCNGLSDGSKSALSGRCWDVPTLNFHHFVAQGRSIAANYSEYTNGVETNPPVTVFFPSRNACGGVFTPDCLGYAGDFITPNPADYHDFALCQGAGSPTSCLGRSFYAGAASDGTDMGVDLNVLDQALIKSQYDSDSFPQ